MKQEKLIRQTLIFFSAFIVLAFFSCSTALAEPTLLKQGMEGDAVRRLQVQLREHGYYSGELDGVFGPNTYQAVVAFQLANKLAADGIAGPQTFRVLQSTNSSLKSTTASSNQGQAVLKEGMSGDNVLSLQKKLKAHGYYQGNLDGEYGGETVAAVKNFQRDRNLAVDGIAGIETLRALESNIASANPSRGASGDRKAQAVIASAKKFLGLKYKWAGASPSGFDCSGFTYYLFRQQGINLPRMSFDQFKTGARVSQLQPGDLVFFTTYEPGPSHVGIYIGNNQFIHSSSGAGKVTITSLSEPYYKGRYLGARRVTS